MSTIKPFYAILTKLNQTEKGWQVTLLLEGPPPDSFVQAKLKARFALAAVEDAPDGDAVLAAKAVKESGRLCRLPSFQRFLLGDFVDLASSPDDAETMTAQALQQKLGVTSRRQITTNPQAYQSFCEIASAFQNASSHEVFGDNL